MAPAGPLVGKVMGQPPNLRELISSADGVTFWAKHDKAMAELGYSPAGSRPGCARRSPPRASSRASGRRAGSGALRGLGAARHHHRRRDHRGEGETAGDTLDAPEPIGSPKTITPPRMAAQLEATDAVAITGIASPSCMPWRARGRRRTRRRRERGPGAEERMGAGDVHALRKRLDRDVRAADQQPEAMPSITPWQIVPLRRMPEAKRKQPAPTMTGSNSAMVAIE